MQMEMVASDKVDLVACNFYLDDGLKYVCLVETYGDENCFPRAISKVAFGTETNHVEIQCRIVIQGILHEDEMINSQFLTRRCKEINEKIAIHYVMYSGVSYIGPREVTEKEIRKIYEQELFKIRKTGQYMGIWQFHQVA